MQELSSISSVIQQSTTLTTLGCSANSTLQSQTNNHDSLKQQQQTQTQTKVNDNPAAYDPNSQKLFAVMQINEESKLNTTGGTTLFQTSSKSDQEPQVLEAPQNWTFKPLDAIPGSATSTILTNKDERSHVNGKSSFILNTMRFDLEMSSPGMDISHSGLTVKSTAKSQKAICKTPMTEGIHYWEINCPYRLTGIFFGVTTIGDNPICVTQSFHSSTERVVGVQLNLIKQEIQYFIQSRYCKKQRTKKLLYKDKPAYNLEWYPLIEFKEVGNLVTLNPFRQNPVPETTSVQELSKLPENLSFDITHSKVSVLQQIIGNRIIVGHSCNSTDFVKSLEKVQNIPVHQITASCDEKGDPKQSFSIMSFVSWADLISMTIILKKEFAYQIIGDRTLAKFLLATIIEKKISKAYKISRKNSHLKDKEFQKWILQNLIGENDKKLIETIKGSQDEHINKDLFGQSVILNKLSEQPKSTHLSSSAKEPKVFCTSKGKILIAESNEIKLLSQEADLTLFSNYPSSITDSVFLNVNQKDLQFLVSNAKIQNYNHINKFYEEIGNTFDGQRVKVDYLNALFGVQTLLQSCSEQYREAESLGNQAFMKDTCKGQIQKVPGANPAQLSFTELHLLMSICVDLEDQLWAMTQAPQVPQQIRDLWPQEKSRIHTTYGRLASMVSITDSENPIKLAEYGLINEGDNAKSFMHFQDPSVQLESIYEKNLVGQLEKQLPKNLLLKGLSTWNVKLDKTLNSLPPSQHMNGLAAPVMEKNKTEIFSTIDEVIEVGNFVLTGNKANSSVNLFSTQMGLNRSLQHNFSKQKYQEVEEGTKQLAHLKFKKIQETNLVKILSKRGEAMALFKETDLKVQDQTQETSIVSIDDKTSVETVFGHLFEMTNLATSNANKKQKVEEDSQTDEDEYEFYSDSVNQSFMQAWLTETNPSKTDSVKLEPEVKPIGSIPSPTPLKKEEEKEKIAPEKKEKIRKELILMSFMPDQIEKAFQKSKTYQIEELIEIILTDVSAEPKLAKEEVKKEDDQISWTVYECIACTFKNDNKPGPLCSICQTPAPEYAKIIKEVKPVVKKEEAEALKAKEREEKRLQEELRKKKIIQEYVTDCQNYFSNTQLLKYFAASNQDGKCLQPVLFGCAIQGAGWTDIHFKWARYRKSYITELFINEENFLKELKMQQTAVESIYPTTLLPRNRSDILRTQNLAVCRVNLDQTHCVFQIGQNLNENSKIHIIVSGVKDGSHISVVFTIDHIGLITSEQLVQFDNMKISAAVSYMNKVLIQSDNKLSLFEVKGLNFTPINSIELRQNEKLTGISNSVASVFDGKSIRTFDISLKAQSKAEIKRSPSQIIQSQEQDKDILSMSIDPSKITVDDLDRYEKMMQGDAACTSSNSLAQVKNNLKQTWQSWEESTFVGPLDIKLDQATNLTQLNIDIEFKCNSLSNLTQQIGKPQVTQIETTQAIKTEIPKVKHGLGVFSMKPFTEESINKSPEAVSSDQTKYLPLIIKRNKGSCYNNQLLPSKMLIDNDQMYASNYAKPEIIFSHMDEQRIQVKKITIRTLLSSKTGAYPLGEGMIFLSDTLQPLDQLDSFSKFTQKDYQDWKQQRAKDLRPIRQNEPVAYFVFDENIQITFELDVNRPSRYILLMPTGFRQKPQAFIQNVESVPMEIQFFGVQGSVIDTDEKILDTIEVNDSAQNLGLEIRSGFDLEVEIKNKSESFKFVIEDVKIDQLKVCNNSVSADTIIQNEAVIGSNIKIEGQSIIRVSDSRLTSLKQIESVIVNLKQKNNKNWNVLYTSVECIQARVGRQTSVASEPLFSNNQIAAFNYRQCLLDPLYFNIVNKQIVQITQDVQVSQRVRSKAIHFLTRIVQKDSRILSLVIKELEVKSFLDANMFGFDQQSMIPIAAELIQALSADHSFLQSLFNILIDKVEQLPNQIIGYQGYEALIGIFKWVLPLNVETTMSVLVKTLCAKVMQKISESQQKDHVLYRTRFLKNASGKCAYPYDTYSFQPQIQIQTQTAVAQVTTIKKRDDLINEVKIKVSKNKSNNQVQLYKIKYFAEVELNALKLYFQSQKAGGQFAISVEVLDNNKVIYQKQYPHYAFHQFVVLPYEAKSDKDSEHCLTISGLNHLSKKLKVMITFQNISASVDPIDQAMIPEVMIETYGKLVENQRTVAIERYHKKICQLTQAQKQKTNSIGKSYKVYDLTSKDKKSHLYLPVITEQKQQVVVASTQQQTNQEVETKDSIELQKLQKCLTEQINGNNLAKSELVDLVQKIASVQQSNIPQAKPELSMQYLVRVASDLSKLILHVKSMKLIPDLKSYFLNSFNDVQNFCLTFFTHLVVNEADQVQFDAITFLRECLIEILTAEERNGLICKIIEQFLSQPFAHISQKAVIESTVMLGVSEQVLINYMVEQLDIQAGKKHIHSPVTMMFSILALLLSNYEKLQLLPVVNDGVKQDDYDEQYKHLFYITLWVSKDTEQLFSNQEQISLLIYLTQSLSELSKVVSFETVVKLSNDIEALQSLTINFICHQNKRINENKSTSLTQLLHRIKLETKPDETKPAQALKAAQELKSILQSMIWHEQVIMTWLVDYKLLGSDLQVENQHQTKLFNLIENNQSLWLSEVNNSIDGYLHLKKQIDQVSLYIGEGDSHEQVNLLPVIKKLISMLNSQKGSKQNDSLLCIWTLALRSLRTVEVSQLVESQILEEMIDAFLSSNDKIQQTTFAQLLRISESIAQNNKNGRFLCKLIFKILNSVKVNNTTQENIVISICQGWLDILAIGHISANSKSDKAEVRLDETTIYSTLEAEDIKEMLQQAAEYFMKYLNQGNFEGSSGAHGVIVMRLQIVSDMLLICKRAISANTKHLALIDLFTECQTNEASRSIVAVAFDKLISWLFLSGRLEDEEKELVQIGSTFLNTPATILNKQITLQLQQVFELVSDCHANTEVIQLALKSLTKVVRAMNQQIIKRSSQDKMSFFVAIKLTKRTNALFTKMISHWLVSDQLVEYFVFTLKGFDFLLDTISSDNKRIGIVEESKTANKERNSALKGSDLENEFLRMTIDTKEDVDQVAVVEKLADDVFSSQILELAKGKFVLQETSGTDPVSNFANVDWPVNKKAYKHKVYNKNIKDSRGYLEHEMLFKLNQTSLLREIQIGMVNYWATESEICIEPISILVQGGPDKDNLQHICTLETITDSAFLSVNSTVFAKNLQEYEDENNFSDVEDIIKSKIQSVVNFKCQWLKFSFRRNVMVCIENSPLAARLTKPTMLSINYISLHGYDLTSVKSDSTPFIVKEQKKAALQVMSQICSGEFNQVLKVIANQSVTIEKIKQQFDLLASLVDDKSAMIEPTFVSISTHNAEMGDWIIKRFITTPGFEKHSSLCGKIILCDKEKVIDRLQLLLMKILETIHQIVNQATGQATLIQRVSPFIDIYIKTIHLVAPELPQQKLIDINVSYQIVVQDLISHLNQVNQGYESSYLFKITHFLVLILSPPLPFINKAIVQTEFAKQLLSEPENRNPEEQHARFHVASILAAQNNDIAIGILNSMGGQLNELLTWIDPSKINAQVAIRWAHFWINCSVDQKVKARLQDSNLPLKLYDLLKETDQKGMENRIIKEFQEEYIVLIVELILKISAGHQQLEEKLTNTVIQDLNTLRQKRDMFFIHKVLLPLIRNEQTVPVCIVDRNLSPSWHLNMDSLSVGGQESKTTQQDNSKFVPSDLIESDVRGNIIKGFKEIVGKVSSSTANTVLSAQWSMAKTITQEQQIGEFPELWRAIQNKGPMVMLIKGQGLDGTKFLFGGFCSKQMPPAPEHFDNEQDIPVNSSPEDFLFVHIQNEGLFFFKPNNNIILEFFTDYDNGGAISMGSDFMQVSLSYDFRLQVGQISSLTEIMLNSVPRSKTGPINGLKQFSGLLSGDHNKVFTAIRGEIWIANNGVKAPSVSFADKPKGLIQKVLSQVQMPMQSVGDAASHPWLSALSPLNFFRSRRVFNVPAHLTIKKAAEILLYLNPEQTSLVLTNSSFEVKNTDTIESVFKQFMSNKEQAEQHQNILDLNFNIEHLTTNILVEEVPTDVISHVLCNYMPKNGFFDMFESQGGVKQFIAVTLVSLTLWKDQTIAESWRLWLREIDSFSEIPLFFQSFLKNKSCQDLLFKILSGEPDKDTDSKKWEQDQKDAVQVNYKILAEIFGVSDDENIRKSAIKAGFLERILERLGAISGEKSRHFDDEASSEDEQPGVPELQRNKSLKQEDKVRQKRSGVGYSAKQGETFNVTAYLDNKKQRNDQIKILVDICTNFFTSQVWVADKEVLSIILESPLLPLLESAFRNGSWLDMAKEAPVYHSYMETKRLGKYFHLVSKSATIIRRKIGTGSACAQFFSYSLSTKFGLLTHRFRKKSKKFKTSDLIEFFEPLPIQKPKPEEKLNQFIQFINTSNQTNINTHYDTTDQYSNNNPFKSPFEMSELQNYMNQFLFEPPKSSLTEQQSQPDLLLASYLNQPDLLTQTETLNLQEMIINPGLQPKILNLASESGGSDWEDIQEESPKLLPPLVKDIQEEDSYYSDDDDDEDMTYNEHILLDPQFNPIVPMVNSTNPTNFIKSQTKTLNQTSSSESSDNFFLPNDQSPEKLARDVTKTYQAVQNSIEEILANQEGDNFIQDALSLPIGNQYRALLQTLRFDYMDMKAGQTDFNHHYKTCAAQNQSPPQSKMVRLAQELADLSNALPSEHTNAIFVRVDKSRVDLMKALITGAIGTPYAHGVYEFDLFCENPYPGGPPKMNLMTTGAGQIRFNPNLYACGKVCLSLLGTWRGNATENWDPKLSTILQVLLSTQAIIMSEEVYFNEPGFENEAGTVEGEKRNEGYMNIVRYGNVKYAMLGQIKKPSKGFETAILRHFYIKKAEILTDVNKWVERADKVEALFTGLVSDHNHQIAKEFQKSKTKYREMLQAVVKELEDELHKLDKPTNYQIKPKEVQAKKVVKQKQLGIDDGKQNLEDVDMGSDEEKEMVQIDTTKNNIDVNDEAVKDRWSRYIGAMGVEAVSKQAAANIFLSGASALGIEIAKNLVLSGCKSFTFHDTKVAQQNDLSGQFFLYEADIGKNRVEACLHRLQQLNFYVKCKAAPSLQIPLTEAELMQEPWNFQNQDVIILSEVSYKTCVAVNNFCRKHGKKFINTDVHGVFGRVFNDFGEKFVVLDKNGEELPDCIITSIESGENALVQLLKNSLHGLEDGNEVHIVGVNGMKLKEGLQQPEENKDCKSGSINETIWKIKVEKSDSFRIGDTRMYEPYISNGLSKPLRPKLDMQFKSYEETMSIIKNEAPHDSSMFISDFEKLNHNDVSHLAFATLDLFMEKNNGQMPAAWSIDDALKFLEIASEIKKLPNETKWDDIKEEKKLLLQFALTARGVLNPLCAFFGGFVAQECIKAITNKFTPTNQVFYYNSVEVLPQFEINEQMLTDPITFKEALKNLKVDSDKSRSDGLRICLGQEIIEKLAHTKLFMIGAGAIGCELLKNYAMLGVGTGKATKEKSAGQIVLTDPDIIEVSNLNRQFLFREKHLRKPKSQTAAAAAIYMNPQLKGNVIARLDKVHEGTNHIFTDKFFEEQTVVTNALDNVAARIYVDQRCVTSKTPLIESGTLGPKGHVQVILPYLTETYAQGSDPEVNTQVPFCTLKMFPEETIHCVEWARDKFSRMFTQVPQSAIKLIEAGENFQPTSHQDLLMLKDGLRLLSKRPTTFIDCIEFARIRFEKLFSNDIKQLVYTYPLDTVTKSGQLFWAPPKRAPVPCVFNKDDPLHRMLVASLACLRAKTFFIEIPNKNPRSEEFRMEVAESADFFKPAAFVPNDKKAKEIQDAVNKADKKPEEGEEEKKEEEQEVIATDSHEQKLADFKSLLKTLNIDKVKSVEETLIKSDEFEKDCDSNFHIDFIYSMANCRSSNYKLKEMDWLTVKIKAGNIVPALATTTASIAGLQALEMIKIVAGIKKIDLRCQFLNLAVPSMQAMEPRDVPKEKLLENLSVSIWDRWEIKDFKNGTLQQFMSNIEETYKGLELKDVMRGNSPIYFAAVMNQEAQKTQKKKTLESSLRTLADSESDPYVDITVTCVRKDDTEQLILSGVPIVRVYF